MLMIRNLCIFIMIYLLYLALVSARPVDEALIKSISFRKNSNDLNIPVYPYHAAWDSNYTCLFTITQYDTLEIKAIAAFPNPLLSFSINSSPWTNMVNNSYTILSGLNLPENLIQVKSSYYDRYHVWTNYTYSYKLFSDNFQLTGVFTVGNVQYTGSSIDNNCTNIFPIETKDLEMILTPSPGTTVSIRHLSFVVYNDSIEIASETPFIYYNFFSNWLENIVEVTVSNNTVRQLFFFRFHRDLPPNEIFSLNMSYDRPLDFYGFDIMPRFHPQVYDYTLVPRFPGLALGNIHLVAKTFYVSACYMTIKPSVSPYNYYWKTSVMTESIWIGVKDDLMNFYCASLDLIYKTSNYTIATYRKSKMTGVSYVVAFLNPLKEESGSASSNSSLIPDGYTYTYDVDGLNSWDSIKSYVPASSLILNYTKFSAVMTYNTIQYPKEPTGVTFLFVPDDLGAYFKFNLNGMDSENDYFFSKKSVYPLLAGNNVIYLNITAEDRTYGIWNKYTIPVQSPDTSIKSLTISPYLTESIDFDFFNITLTVPANQTSLSMNLTLSNINAIYSLTSLGFSLSGGSESQISLNLNQSLEIELFLLDITAESCNFQDQYTIWIIKQDLCGDNRNWMKIESCDDGNEIEGDGCYMCHTETNWVCSGGSFLTPDICELIPEKNLTNNSNSTNTTDNANNTNSANTTDNSNNTNSDNSTDNKANNTDSNNGNTTETKNNTSNNENNSTNTNSTDSGKNNTDDTQKNNTDNGNYPNNTSNDTTELSNITSINSNILTYSELNPFNIVLAVTITITIFHIIVGIRSKKFVYKYAVLAINSGLLPMIWNYQLYFFASFCIFEDYLYFMKSLHWSALVLSYNQQESLTASHKENSFFMNTIYTWGLIFCVFLGKGLIKILKSQRVPQAIQDFYSFSIFFYLFFFASPILFFYSIHTIKNTMYSGDNAINIVISLMSSAIIPATLANVWLMSFRNSKGLADKAVFNKFKPLYEGLKYYIKTLPYNDLKSSSKINSVSIFNENSDEKPRRRNSLEIVSVDEKPKFYSSPWKKNNQSLSPLAEISEFVLPDSPNNLAVTQSSKTENTVTLVCNYHLHSLVCHTLKISFIAAIPNKTATTVFFILLSIAQISILIAKKPFVKPIYTIVHISQNLFSMLFMVCAFALSNDKMQRDISCLIICFGSILAFWTLSLYEILFYLSKLLKKRKKSGQETRDIRTKEKVEDFEKGRFEEILNKREVRINTEPIVIDRNRPVRQCFTFVEVDNTILGG
ncbi:hypothetical protein SteCoe_36130 [Stentor coeruleus]|uniref:Uncharacterized protein n=1 Tax=Stentor coeruleus TaxID=5963 RepID=A0A1R2AQU0_9CILI|nr:hypothetical protein SteCoe_36130 [Stentor coeruleus]